MHYYSPQVFSRSRENQVCLYRKALMCSIFKLHPCIMLTDWSVFSPTDWRNILQPLAADPAPGRGSPEHLRRLPPYIHTPGIQLPRIRKSAHVPRLSFWHKQPPSLTISILKSYDLPFPYVSCEVHRFVHSCDTFWWNREVKWFNTFVLWGRN